MRSNGAEPYLIACGVHGGAGGATAEVGGENCARGVTGHTAEGGAWDSSARAPGRSYGHRELEGRWGSAPSTSTTWTGSWYAQVTDLLRRYHSSKLGSIYRRLHMTVHRISLSRIRVQHRACSRQANTRSSQPRRLVVLVPSANGTDAAVGGPCRPRNWRARPLARVLWQADAAAWYGRARARASRPRAAVPAAAAGAQSALRTPPTPPRAAPPSAAAAVAVRVAQSRCTCVREAFTGGSERA